MSSSKIPALSITKTYVVMCVAGLGLLCIPLIFWLTAYEWQVNQMYTTFDFALFLITESGSAPFYAVFTCLVFFGILVKQYHQDVNWKIILMVILVIQGGAQIGKTILKFSFKEPRPYIALLIAEGTSAVNFYEQKREVRREMIAKNVAAHPNIPVWLAKHWQAETGYSFPSGHAAFGAGWLMIFILFLHVRATKSNIILTSAVAVWSGLMLISRTRLGMHFPIDLFASIIMIYAISAFTFHCVRPHFKKKDR